MSLPRAQALLLLDEYEKQHELKNLEKRLPMVAAEVTANKSRPFVDTIFSKMALDMIKFFILRILHLVTER